MDINFKPSMGLLMMELENVLSAREGLWYPNNILYVSDQFQVYHIRDVFDAYLETRDQVFV